MGSGTAIAFDLSDYTEVTVEKISQNLKLLSIAITHSSIAHDHKMHVQLRRQPKRIYVLEVS